jgi:hypothetical protein
VNAVAMHRGGLRLVVYDATGAGRARVQPLLTASWRHGSRLYRHHPQAPVDDLFGATSWDDALAWLVEVRRGAAIREVQFWGHGLPGRVFIGSDVLEGEEFRLAGRRRSELLALRARWVDERARLWFRTCSAFGGERGHAFARVVADAMGCEVAGHTYVIGPLQSGLHTLRPGAEPTWPQHEGEGAGGPDAPRLMSSWTAPHTITCLHGTIPAGW